jgi:hypothetical protein
MVTGPLLTQELTLTEQCLGFILCHQAVYCDVSRQTRPHRYFHTIYAGVYTMTKARNVNTAAIVDDAVLMLQC